MVSKKYKVNDECISCMACVEVAEKNYKMADSGFAVVYKQPETEEELKQAEEAMEICPVGAIECSEKEENKDVKPILASSNIKKTLDEYPKLKDVLSSLSPKFKRMQNPVVYNTLAQYASFKDAAKVTGVSICEILHSLNRFLGIEDKLVSNMPECISSKSEKAETLAGEEITWTESVERYFYNVESLTEIIKRISNLNAQENIVIFSVDVPVELLKTVEGLGYKYNVEKGKDYRLSVFNPKKEQILLDLSWQERKEDFEILDVRAMKTDPFDIIIKKAYEKEEGNGFVLVQRFEPYPLINMLSEMGYDYVSEQLGVNEFRIYFYKVPEIVDENAPKTEKVDMVIQSATPVAYPVIMRLLQSEKIRKAVNIRELKVWEETEKHLAWITNGKADVSFTALITSLKIQRYDVKIPALFVWDNFVMLARYKAKSFGDVRGHDIHTPLFGEAPPAKITKYLIKASGYDVDDFNFVFGKPFGRPEEIYADFVTGKADTAILREPEASYAIKIMQDRGEEFSVISFNEIWNKINQGFGSFPNAGIAIKGEFARNNPELVDVFLEELKDAIEWVNKNKEEAANLSFDLMRQPVDRVDLFINRVNFDYVSGDELVAKVKDYFKVLVEHNIIDNKISDDYYDIFKL
ncbi:MAG: ferredoxin [Bacteroidota bacterium]|nr:ferredoxin [Bacteroidota bacterium]